MSRPTIDAERLAMKIRALADVLISTNPGDLDPQTIGSVGLMLWDYSEDVQQLAKEKAK